MIHEKEKHCCSLFLMSSFFGYSSTTSQLDNAHQNYRDQECQTHSFMDSTCMTPIKMEVHISITDDEQGEVSDAKRGSTTQRNAVSVNVLQLVTQT